MAIKMIAVDMDGTFLDENSNYKKNRIIIYDRQEILCQRAERTCPYE